MHTRKLLFATMLLTAWSGACQTTMAAEPSVAPTAAERWGDSGEAGEPSFVKHVVPLLGKLGCSNRTCHGSFQGQGGFRLSLFGYDPNADHLELTADEERGARVDSQSPEQSLALQKALGQIDHDGGQRFDPDSWQHRLLLAWITAGARHDPASAPYLDRLEVLPLEATLALDQSLTMRTIAHFSDGTTEDVTPLTSFASNDDSVVTVTEDGQVVVSGAGDTSIVASYAGGVVTAQMLVPLANSRGEFDYPAHNPIDDFVAAKLRKLGIEPSELCSDEVFLRRAYVDTIGTLPTADEARSFLADADPHKRARLIDALLERPEYAQYWGSILSDMTGNNQQNVNNFLKVSWIWQQWLEDKLARNVPWDELVGGIVTATSREGRTLEEYEAEVRAVAARLEPREGFDDGAYARRQTLDQYWLKRMPDRDKALATRTANAFLGVQIQCAECHKHPFDRWTQDDFEGFTSFFRAVTITDLDGAPRSQNGYDYDRVALYVGVDRDYTRIVRDHPPRILGGPIVEIEEGVDPRVALWEWMRSPENLYFARSIANRLWGHYFGLGIVDPVDDFNSANPPSNPQLLDWLARDFIEHEFDLKHLHRRILNSRTYQLSYAPNDTNRGDRRNFSHALVKRMPAEVALDAVAQVTGTRLKFNGYAAPEGVRAIGLAVSTRFGASEYFMTTFGRPERQQTCDCERSNEPALAQALYFINDQDIHGRIADPQGGLTQLLDAVDDDAAAIDALYLACLARHATPTELDTVQAHLRSADSRREGFEDLLWSLLNVRDFLFVK